MGFVQICAEVAGVKPIMRCVGGRPAGDGSSTFSRHDALFPFPNVNYVLDINASIQAGIAPPPVSLYSLIASALDTLRASPERRSWSRSLAERAYLDMSA